MKRKIGLLIPNMLHGGAEKVLSQLSHMLSKDNEVYLILFDGSSISYDYSGELIDLHRKSKKGQTAKFLNLIIRVHKFNIIKKNLKLDLVISFLRSANLVNYFSNDLGRKLISCRGYSDFRNSNTLYAKMLKKIDGIIFPSKTMSEEFINMNPTVKEKVFMLHNPINFENISKLKMEEVNRDFETFINEHRTICTLGSFKKDKGYWHLIKAFCVLKETVSDAGLVFIGDGGELERDIKKMSLESGYGNDILFLGYQSNPYKFITKCNVFVLSSIHEGFPNALVEAMACGIPVISTDCKTGPKEILRKTSININECEKITDYGILVSNFEDKINYDISTIDLNETKMAEKIVELLSDEQMRLKYSELSIKRAQEFDHSSYLANLMGIINSIEKSS